jgi:RHS repeat-associated protein
MLHETESRLGLSPLFNRVLARCLAGVLAFNVFAPAMAGMIPKIADPIKPVIDPRGSWLPKVKEQVDGEVKPRPVSVSPKPSFLSELNEVGRLQYPITPKQVRVRIAQAESSRMTRTERARAQIRVGEGYLGLKEPAIAEDWFLKASKSSIQDSIEFGIARYSTAISLFRQGRYDESQQAFEKAIASRAVGFDRRSATAFYAIAKNCAGYHQIRENAGITEPFHLDPLCGPAAVARILKVLGKDYSEEIVTSRVRYTGEGSSFADLTEAAPKFGLEAYQISIANKKALKELFRLNKGVPLVARVEHDHFVAVGGADEKGVTYFCSDCGNWPGGEKRVTWAQWNLMEADAFLAIAPKGSEYQSALAAMAKPSANVVKAMWMQPIGNVPPVKSVESQLIAAGVNRINPIPIYCGWRNGGLMPPCNLPSCHPTMVGPAGGHPSTGQATTMGPGAPQVSNDAGGPSVSFSPSYNSHSTVQSELGIGWYHSYNLAVTVRGGGDGLAPVTSGEPGGEPHRFPMQGELIEPNGYKIAFEATLDGKPSATVPVIPCAISQAEIHSLKINWIWDSTAQADRIEVIFKDRTRLVSRPSSGPAYSIEPGKSYQEQVIPNGTHAYRPIQFIYDALGDYIELVHSPFADTQYPTEIVPRLTAVKDRNGVSLLTLNLSSDGYLSSTVDKFGRKVIYKIEQINNTHAENPPPYFVQVPGKYLTEVSQPCPSSATQADLAVKYTYENFGNGEANNNPADPGGPAIPQTYPYLKTIQKPNPGYDSSIPGSTPLSTWTYHYPSANNYPIGANPPQAVVEGITDPNGNLTEFLSSPSTNTTTIRVKDSAGVIMEQGTVEYNASAQIQATRDADGEITSFTQYGYNHRPAEITAYVSATKQYTQKIGYDAQNNVTWKQRIDQGVFGGGNVGIATRFTYSTANWWGGELQEVQQGTGTDPQTFVPTRAKTTYSYYPNGLLQTVNSPVPGQTSVNATLQPITYTYDSLANILTIRTPGNNAEAFHTTTFNYTTDGVYSTTAKKGQPVVITNSNGEKTHFRYDTRGNLTQTWDNIGNTTDFTYDPLSDQQIEVKRPATGNTGAGRSMTIKTYSWLGGPVNRIESFSEAGGAAHRIISMSYGKAGELLSRTGRNEDVYITYDGAYRTKTVRDGFNNSAHTTSYTYNNKGQLTEIVQPSGVLGSSTDITHFTNYDLQGNLLSRTDGRGLVTNFIYDEPNGNLSEIQYPGATSQNVTLTYDEYQRPTGWTNGTGSETTAYDESDAILSVTTNYAGMTGSKTISYGYYPDGSRQMMTHPGDNWAYTYDKAGRCTGFSTTEGASSFVYDPAGRMIQRNLPYGISTDYYYNQLGLLTGLDNNADEVKSRFENLTYDGAFNLKSLSHSVSQVPDMDGTINFSYDTKDRLTSEVSTRYGGYTENQVYDGAGNPTTFRNTSGIPYNGANQRTSQNYIYDGSGNPTKWKNINATFDRENRMLSYGTQTNGFRADNLRAWRQDAPSQPSTKQYFLYDNGNVICELNSAGNVIARNAFAPDGLVSRVEGASNIMFYMFDQQGNVVNVLDPSKNDNIFLAYNAWGVRNYAYPDIDKGGLSQPFSYNGKWGYYLDTKTNLYYCQNRFYDPAVGRWLTRDPIGFAGGVNVYGYCASMPVGKLDSEGLNWEDSHYTEKDRLEDEKRLRDEEALRRALEDWLSKKPWPFSGDGNMPADSSPGGYTLDHDLQELCLVGDTFTKQDLRNAINDMNDVKPRDKQDMLELVRKLRGTSCGSLLAYCNHLMRHGGEGVHKGASKCMLIYNAVCAGGVNNP